MSEARAARPVGGMALTAAGCSAHVACMPDVHEQCCCREEKERRRKKEPREKFKEGREPLEGIQLRGIFGRLFEGFYWGFPTKIY